ncbi:protein ELFN1-like [Thalassophryne amazonica]|uniref:protein ELFN1-like n=1 Tax=Thalassophryne amazonica TaxID=390379 RepID=UPI00147200A0|nr:protein ELFN1-like [Thalassophryne amazonica]
MANVVGQLSPLDTVTASQMAQATGRGRQKCDATRGSSSALLSAARSFLCWLTLLSVIRLPTVTGDCWLIEGEKGFVWLAICSMNQPPYEAIPSHINSTIVDLRLNENKIRSIHYSSLSRFGNLTYLNLTKNDISYVEDGAFSAQFNLQVLQMGFNKLRNLTEGMLRGLGKLQYLYLQANLIETVTPNTFWECPNIENIDLSMNRIQVLDGSLFSVLSKLTTCELYTNPFNCSCELLSFLRWLNSFPNRTSERMVCDYPPEFSGYNLLSPNPRMAASRNALHILSIVCTDNGSNVTPYFIIGSSDSTTLPPDFASPCGLDDCASGTPPDEVISLSPIFSDTNPSMTLKQVMHSSAVITVQIPNPYRKMYILMLYNNSFFTVIQNLKSHREDVELKNLTPNTDYTYCVASIRNSLRFNHTCLTISTGRRAGAESVANQSSATHYIMTILGCLFGMLIFLGFVVHCLRKKRIMEEKERKMSRIQRTLIELKYGGEGDIEGGSGGSVSQKLSAGDSISRMPYLPQGGEIDPYKLQEVIETPAHKPAKLNYMEVRGSGVEREREREMSPQANPQGSVAEISTIAKEVDKVNQIINNCIDALKSESTSFQQGIKSPSAGGGSVSTAEPQLVLLSDQSGERGERGGEFLSPVYKGGRGGREDRGRTYHQSLQRHHSMEAPPTSKRPSTSSSPGSARSPRSFRSEGGYHASESRYIERTSPGERGGGGGEAIRTVTPAAAILRAEAQRIRQYNEHRHSYPGSQQHLQELQHHPQIMQELHHHPGGRKPSVLDPLTLSRQAKQREMVYSQLAPNYQLSPHYHNLSYCSSPEEDEEEEGLLCTPTLGLWERFKLHRKRHRQASMEDEGYVAAGHALRRKVQFAKDEDLHDILDYWKGVSAQQKA